MVDSCPTMKVLPWAEGQGEYVEINTHDFDPTLHTRLPGDNTPLPGPFDGVSRLVLVELAVAEFKAHLEPLSDDELREMVALAQDRRATEAGGDEGDYAAVEPKAPFNGADPAKFDHDHDGKPGGDLSAAATLFGSDTLGAHVQVCGQAIQLDAVVAAAHAASGLSVDAWNALAEVEREASLSATIERLNGNAEAFEAEIPASARVEAEEHRKPEPVIKPATEQASLHDLTVKQLRALAADKSYDLGDATKKDDIVAAIELAIEAAGPGGA